MTRRMLALLFTFMVGVIVGNVAIRRAPTSTALPSPGAISPVFATFTNSAIGHLPVALAYAPNAGTARQGREQVVELLLAHGAEAKASRRVATERKYYVAGARTDDRRPANADPLMVVVVVVVIVVVAVEIAVADCEQYRGSQQVPPER